LRELRENPAIGWRVVGFVDDDAAKRSTRMEGVPVIGGVERLQYAVEATGATRLILSTSTLGPDRMDAVLDLCQARDIALHSARITFEPARLGACRD
jgi:FlaA1/EpsC-like NDP-sugar epimerase